jgi:hypothetical protein
MVKFLSGFIFAVAAIATAAYIYAFQVFKEPLPVSGAQLKELWHDSAKDSQARWMLISKSDSAYILCLEYPTKRYKFSVSPKDISIQVDNQALPIHVHSKDARLVSSPEHTFAEEIPE